MSATFTKEDLERIADLFQGQAKDAQERAHKADAAYHGGSAIAYLEAATYLRWFVTTRDEQKP